MGVRAYEFDEGRMVLLHDSVTEMPLPVSGHTFADIEEAYAWLAWLRTTYHRDARTMDADELSAAVERWVGEGKPGVEP